MQLEPSRIARVNTCESLAVSCPEGNLVVSRPREVKVHHLRSPKHGHGLFKSNVSYHSAGLSIDCEHAVLYNDNNLVVFRLESLVPPDLGSFPIFGKQFRKSEYILNVLLGRNSLIIVTNECLLAFDIIRGGNLPLGRIPHGAFDCSGITCHEDDTHLIIMLGQRGSDKNGYKVGRINIIKLRFDGNVEPNNTSTISIPGHDWPKLLAYNAATKTLVCITRLRNRVMAWEMDNGFSPLLMHPFDFVHRYTEVGKPLLYQQ